jgi:hypothetical protein
MGYDGQGLGKRRQGILSPIVVTPWAKHEGLGFDGRSENSITMKKTIFVKEKDMPELACSSGEGETIVSEGVISPPPHPCGRLKERNNEESLQTQPTPALRDNNKPINERKKKKKTRRSTSNKKFLVCHCCKKRGHTIHNCWYAEACSFCGKKGHCEAACWKKQAMFPRPDCFQKLNERRLLQSNNIHKGTWRGGVCQAILVVAMKFFHHCKLSGHWEAKCWQLHPELHPRNTQQEKSNRNRVLLYICVYGCISDTFLLYY